MYLHLLVPSTYTFSLMKCWYFWYQRSNSLERVASSFLTMVNPIERSVWPASVSGRSVNFLWMIFNWWNWHICTGIPSKTLGMPVLPSKTTPRNLKPLDSRFCFNSSYAPFVSDSIQLQARFAFSFGSLAVSKRFSPIWVASNIQMISCGEILELFLVSALSRAFLIQFLPLLNRSWRSVMVCLFQTCSFQIFFSSFWGLRLFWNCLWQEIHR